MSMANLENVVFSFYEIELDLDHAKDDYIEYNPEDAVLNLLEAQAHITTLLAQIARVCFGIDTPEEAKERLARVASGKYVEREG